jgi:predicted CopG family antitoxin
MIKTQVQIPDELYNKAKMLAKQKEWSFAEVMRRGLEYMTATNLTLPTDVSWELPVLKGGKTVSMADVDNAIANERDNIAMG